MHLDAISFYSSVWFRVFTSVRYMHHSCWEFRNNLMMIYHNRDSKQMFLIIVPPVCEVYSLPVQTLVAFYMIKREWHTCSWSFAHVLIPCSPELLSMRYRMYATMSYFAYTTFEKVLNWAKKVDILNKIGLVGRKVRTMTIRFLCRTLSLLPCHFFRLSFVKFYSHYANLSTSHTILNMSYHNILLIVVAIWMIEQRLHLGYSNCLVRVQTI
jgi:hypothetical protein